MNLTPQFFIISDLHLGHFNIIKYAWRTKGYEELFLKRWNEVVKKKDKVLMLGDLSLTGKEKTIEYCKQLKGEKFLVRGNHDGHSVGWYRDCGFSVVEPIYKVFKDKYENRYPVLFTHEPVVDLPKNWFNVHGHIHRGVHRDYDLTERHFNVCVEPLNYRPKPLYEILDYFKKITIRKQSRKEAK